LGKLSPFLKNTQKIRHLTQAVVAGVMFHLFGIRVLRNFILFVLLGLSLVGCQSTQTTNTTTKKVPLVSFGMIFGVTLDDSRNVSNIQLARVEDIEQKKESDFRPNENYMASAIRQLKAKEYDKDAKLNEEFFLICLYSQFRPDQALCGGEM
jgi:hypothetical protein